MSSTHDIGPLFWQSIRLDRKAPRFHRAPTHEIERPFRLSNSVIVRFWGERGLVFGRWRPTDWTEEEALRYATQAQDLDPLGPDGRLSEQYHRELL